MSTEPHETRSEPARVAEASKSAVITSWSFISPGLQSGCCESVRPKGPSARMFASHEMKDTTELAIGISLAGFEFYCGRCCELLRIVRV